MYLGGNATKTVRGGVSEMATTKSVPVIQAGPRGVLSMLLLMTTPVVSALTNYYV